MAPASGLPRIAIIGAGPGGLTLASLLSSHRPSIPYTIFDLRPAPSDTFTLTPSGSLDLHAESGLRALSHCNLLDKFQSLQRTCTEDTIIADKQGEIRWRDNGGGQHGEQGRPEISRNDLTALLLSSVPHENVKWEHKLLSITSNPAPSTSKWTLRFASQFDREEVSDFDLIIGADGAWSRVRTLLSETKPHFSGVSCITLTIPHVTAQFPHLAKLVGEGSFYAAAEKKALIAQRGSLDSVRMYVMLYSEQETFLASSGLAVAAQSPAALKARLLDDDKELFGGWGEGIKELIAAGCDADGEVGCEISAVPMYMLPIGFTWTHVPDVTVIGDAAHLMTPFAGEGVNNAMLDALELARGIFTVIEDGNVDEVVKEYEVRMWERTKDLAAETWANLQIIFADDAPEGFVKLMESYGPPPQGDA